MNPYLIIAALCVAVAAFISGEYDGRARGATAERSAWQTKQVGELSLANAEIKSLEEAARASEQAHTQALADISTNHEREVQDAEVQRKKDIAAARSGALRLRDPGATAVQSCASSTPQTAASASGRDDGSGGGLSGIAAEFLLTQADRADAIVRQLAACQAVIKADRAP
jgi:hypothetical protein